MPVTDYADHDLVARAVRGARPHKYGPAPRWVAVMYTFGLGSTYAHDLCRLHGLDPDEVVDGVRCLACEPRAPNRCYTE